MRRLLLIAICLLPLQLFAQPDWLLHKSFAAKYYHIDSLIVRNRNNNSQLLDTLEMLSAWSKEHGDDELSYFAALTRLKFIVENRDHITIENKAQLSAFEIDERNNKYQYCHAVLLEFLGGYYWNGINNQALAFEYYLAAYNLYAGFSSDDFPPKREYLYNLGLSFYTYGDYENAIRYLNEAIATKPSRTSDFTSPLYTTLGLCYRYLKKYDSSDLYFNLVYRDSTNGWRTITAGNIGINYYYQKRYDEAIPLLKEEIDKSFGSGNNIRSSSNSLYILSCIYLEKNELAQAEDAIVKALQASEKKRFWSDYKMADHLFTQLHKVYTAKKNYQLANLYADSAIMARDSADAQYNALKLVRAKEKDEIAQNKLQQEQLRNQKNMQNIIRDSLLVVILLLTVIGVLFINRQRMKHKKLESEKETAESELEAAETQLDGFRNTVHEKNLLIEHFSDEMAKIKKGQEEMVDNELISKLERSIILTDEQWEDFRIMFEKVHKGFFAALKKKIPDLTQSETRFLALTKLKLTSKEMAAMLGISTATIRSYRHRLRKKLDMDKDGLVDDLLDDI